MTWRFDLKSTILLASLAFAIFLSGCQLEPNFEMEKQKLMALHEAQKQAHLNENVAQFVDQFADPMIAINKGMIRSMTRDASFNRVDNYFKSVIIKEWKDIKPPIIDFSEDGTMAYMIVEKLVLLTFENEQNIAMDESTHFAWVSIFKKNGEKEWELVCNVSTDKPIENE